MTDIFRVAVPHTVSPAVNLTVRSKHTKTSQPNGNPAVTTTYYAGAQEAEVNNGQATVKTYWPYGLGVEIDQPGSNTSELHWSHHDRLGSIISISDSSGNLKEKLAYDSWGKRRTTDGSATPDNLDGQVDNKGYTGHEMLDQLDLVHMNGRIYDPLMARFLSADPMIQDPAHSQSYNRYTYVWNNPTNLTDPTGYKAQDTWIDDELKRQAAKDPFGNWSVVYGERKGSVTATVLNTENKNNNSLDHSAKPPEDVAKIGVMGAVVQNDALKQGRCSTPSNACTEQNARYEAAFKARAEGDAIKPFTLVEETAASIVTGNFVFRGLKWGIGAIFAGRTTEIILSESRALTTYYPTNDGFLGAATQLTLKEGQIINRFGGSEYSRFFSPPEISAFARSLPPGVAEEQLRTFQVLKSFEVQSGTVAPAFGQFGLGTQYRSSMQLGDLLKNEFLKEIK